MRADRGNSCGMLRAVFGASSRCTFDEQRRRRSSMTIARCWIRWGVTPCFALVVACFGCSSSEFQTAPAGDGGNTDTSTVADTTRPLCVTPPTATGKEATFCEFEARLFSRCGQCEDCRQTNLNGCVQWAGALSESFKTTLMACADVLACGDYTNYATDKCVAEKSATVTPTSAQKAAKDAYCAACPLNAYECDHFFDFAGGDAGADAGPRGIGAMVMYASDEIVKSITDGCKGGLSCNAAGYQLCSVGKFCNQTAPDACNKGFCFK
jgi:hypothetical protein